MPNERQLTLMKCAFTVDEVLDQLLRWDGEDVDTVAVIQETLNDARDEIFEQASPELVVPWRGKEAAIRAIEEDPNFSPWEDDNYQALRDAREALFRAIVDEARGEE